MCSMNTLHTPVATPILSIDLNVSAEIVTLGQNEPV